MQVLISKYLANEASAEEISLVESWRKESTNNEELFQSYKEIWKLSGNSTNWIDAHKTIVWDKIYSSIEDQNKIPLGAKPKSIKSYILTAIVAASIALLVGMGIPHLISEPESERVTTVRTPKGQRSEVILPDGTIANLNSESQIEYNNNYTVNNRDIRMKGEIFLDVAKQKNSTFNLYADNVKIEVLGTAFSVDARENNENINISLLRGSVSVSSEYLDESVLLEVNHKLIINKQNRAYEVVECDVETESLWRHGQLKLQEASFEKLMYSLEHWYGINISYEETNHDDKYWLTLKTESLTDALKLINKIKPIEYTISGEEVTVKEK